MKTHPVAHPACSGLLAVALYTTPDQVESQLGTLQFFDGFPDAALDRL
jgi:hypothetical protein